MSARETIDGQSNQNQTNLPLKDWFVRDNARLLNTFPLRPAVLDNHFPIQPEGKIDYEQDIAAQINEIDDRARSNVIS